MNKEIFSYGVGIWMISLANLISRIEKIEFLFHMYFALAIMVWGLLISRRRRKE